MSHKWCIYWGGMCLLLGWFCQCQPLPRPAAKTSKTVQLQRLEYNYNNIGEPPAFRKAILHMDRHQTQVWICDPFDTLLYTQYATPDSALYHIGQALHQAKLRPKRPVNSDCAGGLIHGLTWYAYHIKTQELDTARGWQYQCGGQLSGSLAGDVLAWRQMVDPWWPPLDSLIHATRQTDKINKRK